MIRTPCPKDSIASRSMAPERYRKEGITEAREIEGGREGGKDTGREGGRQGGRGRAGYMALGQESERASESDIRPLEGARLRLRLRLREREREIERGRERANERENERERAKESKSERGKIEKERGRERERERKRECFCPESYFSFFAPLPPDTCALTSPPNHGQSPKPGCDRDVTSF
jgi:hypothetical protein